jgi:hypothetical protein
MLFLCCISVANECTIEEREIDSIISTTLQVQMECQQQSTTCSAPGDDTCGCPNLRGQMHAAIVGFTM